MALGVRIGHHESVGVGICSSDLGVRTGHLVAVEVRKCSLVTVRDQTGHLVYADFRIQHLKSVECKDRIARNCRRPYRKL